MFLSQNMLRSILKILPIALLIATKVSSLPTSTIVDNGIIDTFNKRETETTALPPIKLTALKYGGDPDIVEYSRLKDDVQSHRVEEKLTSTLSHEQDGISRAAATSENDNAELPVASSSAKSSENLVGGGEKHIRNDTFNNDSSTNHLKMHISDGIDNAVLQRADFTAVTPKMAEMIGKNDLIVETTTEEILTDVENVVAQQIDSNINSSFINTLSTSTPIIQAQFNDDIEAKSDLLHSINLPLNKNVNNLDAVNDEREDNETTTTTKRTTRLLPLPHLIMSTATISSATTSPLFNSSFNKGIIEPSNENHIEATHNDDDNNDDEIHTADNFQNVNDVTEKRAKYINGNVTGAEKQQHTKHNHLPPIPETARAWMLAAMKTVPPNNMNNTSDNDNDHYHHYYKKNTTKMQLINTNRNNGSVDNASNEKILHDWTQITMIDPSYGDASTTTKPQLESERLEMEKQIIHNGSTIGSEGGWPYGASSAGYNVETTTTLSTHLPNVVNEILYEPTKSSLHSSTRPPVINYDGDDIRKQSAVDRAQVTYILDTTLAPETTSTSGTVMKVDQIATTTTTTISTTDKHNNGDMSFIKTTTIIPISTSARLHYEETSDRGEQQTHLDENNIVTTAQTALAAERRENNEQENEKYKLTTESNNATPAGIIMSTTPTPMPTATISSPLPNVHTDDMNLTTTSTQSSPAIANAANEVNVDTGAAANNESLNNVSADNNNNNNTITTQFEHSSSETTTTLSTLIASEVNGTIERRNFTEGGELTSELTNTTSAVETVTVTKEEETDRTKTAVNNVGLETATTTTTTAVETLANIGISTTDAALLNTTTTTTTTTTESSSSPPPLPPNTRIDHSNLTLDFLKTTTEIAATTNTSLKEQEHQQIGDNFSSTIRTNIQEDNNNRNESDANVVVVIPTSTLISTITTTTTRTVETSSSTSSLNENELFISSVTPEATTTRITESTPIFKENLLPIGSIAETTTTTTAAAAAAPAIDKVVVDYITTTTTTKTTDVTPVVQVQVFQTDPVNNGVSSSVNASHDSESSIETNVIDPNKVDNIKSTIALESTTPITTTTTIVATNETNSIGAEGEKVSEGEAKVQPTTTMGILPLENISTATTTTTTTATTSMQTTIEDSSSTTRKGASTTTATITPIIVTTLVEDIYSIFPSSTTTTTTLITPTTSTSTIASTSSSSSSSTSSSNNTPLHPPVITSVPSTQLPPSRIIEEEETSTTAGATTPIAMLPPVIISGNNREVSGGGGGGGIAAVTPSSSSSSPPIDVQTHDGNLHSTSSSAADVHETDVNVIIAITVSVIGVIALILLVAFLYLIRKRQKQMSYGQRCRPVSLDAYSLDNVSVLGSVRRKGAHRASKRSYGNVAFDDPSLRHNVLTAMELGKFAERRSSIFEEFRDVPQIIARADEVPQGCEDKNRYANVIPLPETRVILRQQNDDEKTEYINANYVRGPKDPPNYYIACQAPLETTVNDFWRMIWEQESRVIIQATDLTENGIEKCAEYLPPSVTLDNHTTFGDFQITLKHREVKERYAISTIMLRNTVEGVSRELTHYWYKWPEAGVPNEEAPLIAMLLEARSSLKSYAIEQSNELKGQKSSTMTLKSTNGNAGADTGNGNVSAASIVCDGDSLELKETNRGSAKPEEINGNLSAEKLKVTSAAAAAAAAKSQGPLTVHCSPGTGRTGTIIACDMAIRSLETPKRSVDIPQIVYYVRRGRASAVQTKDQYEFIYKVANMYATKITNLSNDN